MLVQQKVPLRVSLPPHTALKMLYAPKDEVGLVLFGTRSASPRRLAHASISLHPSATNNQLAEIGYKHITTSRDIDVPDLPLLRTIERPGPGGSEGDCTCISVRSNDTHLPPAAVIDALIVAMDLLIRKAGKYQRRVRTYGRTLFSLGCIIYTYPSC